MSAAVSQSDSDEFIQAAIEALDQDSNQGKSKFAENVYQVADWALEVDKGFSDVTYGLADMTKQHGTTFPDLSTFLNKWRGYNQRWTTHLALSRDVASEQAAVLRRFDAVFLDMIDCIQTEQDRKDAIIELKQFAQEGHGDSEKMAQGFKSLKDDVQLWVVEFDQWLKKTGTELKQEAEALQKQIEALKDKIEELDKEIIAATAALLGSAAAVGTLVGVIGLVAAAVTLTALVVKRVEKTRDLSEKRNELAEVNRKQEALAHIKTSFDGLKPEIAMICHRLALFGEIWDSVRAQTIAFQKTLESGMDAITNLRFKKEVQLARKICTPLRHGLEVYASQLERRK